MRSPSCADRGGPQLFENSSIASRPVPEQRQQPANGNRQRAEPKTINLPRSKTRGAAAAEDAQRVLTEQNSVYLFCTCTHAFE